MALVTTFPLDGDPFGPGFLVEVTTDLVGPLEPGSFWTFTLTAPANEGLIASCTRPASGAVVLAVMKSGTDTTTFIHPVERGTENGVSGQLKIELTEPSSGVVDTLDVPIVVDRVSGQSAELMQWIFHNTSRSGQGLTEDEHNAVLQTNTGVIALAGINPIDLLGGLGDAMRSSAPLAFGSLGDIMGPLTGDGTLTAPPALHVIMGVYWVATTIPVGLGHRHGNSEEYPARLVQWRTTHVVGGIEMTTEIVDAVTHRELWRFRQQNPHAVDYSVLPQVEIFARYWLFP